MNLHKKIGLFLLFCIIPRAYCRFFKKLPPPLPDTSWKLKRTQSADLKRMEILCFLKKNLYPGKEQDSSSTMPHNLQLILLCPLVAEALQVRPKQINLLILFYQQLDKISLHDFLVLHLLFLLFMNGTRNVMQIGVKNQCLK